MQNNATIRKRDILRYVALPGIRPRIAELFGRGFQYIPYFIAVIFESVRLIPRMHPYMNAQNIGRYGIRHVLAEAANNLVLDRKNIDQIMIFFMVILAMVIVLVQIILVFMALFMQPSFAGALPANFAEFFIPGAYPSTPPQNPQQDLALILLDMVFGVPEMFNSCVDQVANPGVSCESNSGVPIGISPDMVPFLANPGPIPEQNATHWAEWPYPLHEGLHQLFAVYSYGLLVIAMLITIYFIITIIAETAQTGTAFGKRFNKVWAPLRIVVAFGLLVPLTIGLNSGQYIVLYAAKFGSGFASNGWAFFNTSIATHYYENMGENVSTPNSPEFGALAQFFLAAATCKSAYMMGQDYTENETDNFHIVPYLVKKQTETPNAYPLTDPGGQIPGVGAITSTDSYEDIMGVGNFGYKSNRLVLRFGHRDENQFKDYLGNVKPICGEIVINIEDSREPGEAEPGPEIIQRYYWWLVKRFWWSEGRLDPTIAGTNERHSEFFACDALASDTCNPVNQVEPDADFRGDMMYYLDAQFRNVITGTGFPDNGGYSMGAVPAQRASGSWDIPAELVEKGWGGAALWYNRIAQMNGAVTSAAFNIPMPSLYPEIMEYVRKRKEQDEQNVSLQDRFTPTLTGQNAIDFEPDIYGEYAVAMNNAYRFWGDANVGASTQIEPTGNIIIDGINTIFGTHGLFDMRKNADVNPLAQLVGLGRGMVEASIRNLGYAAMGTTAGALTKSLSDIAGPLLGTASSFLITVAMMSLTAGFILFYIVPFLPFIYFFFAVGGWVKGIFEAMVGVPLWALAHIRIDGDGLPGQAAVNGYFLIFEIFLRPILTVFGLLASILIFSAMVQTLNDIFDLVVGNLAGFDTNEETTDSAGTGILYIEYYRTAIDELFFTIIYVMVVFMMAQSSFKLIDQIPNNILRWMNQNVASFNDSRQDPAENLVSTSQMGAQQATQGLGGGLSKLSGSLTS